MCGISGLVLQRGELNKTRLEKSLNTLRHRGPDQSNIFLSDTVGLAHARLAIIDLEGGLQPLYSEDKNLILVANGEIYNYIELRKELAQHGYHCVTDSDCDVIIQAYRCFGDNFIQRLYGMFAFALYDKSKHRLLLARDRLGIKPLYIGYLGSGIAFASEIKALLPFFDNKPAINPTALGQYLQQQFSTGQDTMFKAIERIGAGEQIIIERGRIVSRKYYWSALAIQPRQIEIEEAMTEFEVLMESVMHQHMRSDVPFGLFLSGGVDSALLLALLDRYGAKPVRTFSVGFAGTELVDELPLAERVAKRFGSKHTSLRPTADELFFTMADCVWLADDLMRDFANLPSNMLARAAAKELKVVFSGEGGDEVFAGYGRYRTGWLERTIKAWFYPGSKGYRTSVLIKPAVAKHLLISELVIAASHTRQVFVDSWKKTPGQWSDLQRMQYLDLHHSLPDNLLVKADRMLMGSGLEGRVPFLDHRVVEFGMSLPDELKVSGKQGKYFIKQWAEQRLPKEHLYAKKRGFHVPVQQWLGTTLKTHLADVLPRNRAIKEWFQVDAVVELLNKTKRDNQATRIIWSLLEFAIWHRLFVEGDGRRPPAQIDPVELLAD